MSNKLCTIVGMGPGVSLSVAKKFAGEGFRIAMIARNPEKLKGYEAELKSIGVESKSFAADAGDFDNLEKAFQEIKTQMGDTDVLVYNVALMKPGKPSQTPASVFVEDFKVNVAGAVLSAQMVLPAMMEKNAGSIFLTGGGLSLEPYPMFSSLAVGKAGIRNLAYSLAAELKSTNIHVATVTICGLVKPDTKFDPDKIAEEYWKLHQQPKGGYETEMIFK